MKKERKSTVWRMDPDDVIDRSGGLVVRAPGPGRHSRLQARGRLDVCLVHRPTKISVEKSCVFDPDSAKEKKELLQRLKAELYPELERKVARFLRVPGRSGK